MTTAKREGLNSLVIFRIFYIVFIILVNLGLNSAGAAGVSVSVAPSSASLSAASSPQQFSATVAGSSNTGVTWSISPAVGSISASGLYTPPSVIVSAQTVTVTVTSMADSTQSAAAAIALTPLTIETSPSFITLTSGSQTAQFTVAVTGASNPAVNWTLNPQVGTLTQNGLYTAPASFTAAQTIGVRATSVADPTKFWASGVILSPAVSVSVSPVSVNLTAGAATLQFTAALGGTSNTAVTWSISPQLGSISSAGVYTPPASISAQQTVTVTAVSSADSTKSASAAILLYPAATVSVTPANATIAAGSAQQLSATVAGPSNSSVSWSASPQTGTVSSSGLYTAPATIAAPQNVTVTATSMANPTQTAAAILTLVPLVAIAVSPLSVSLTSAAAPQQFSVSVTNTGNTAVTWSISPQVGSISSSGLYTPPATVSSQQTVTVTAASVAQSSQFATANIALFPPLTVTVAPATASLNSSSAPLQFTATLSGASSVPIVWSISPQVGTISSSGLYTPPSSVTTQQTVTVVATTSVGGTRAGQAAITLSPPVTSGQTLATFQLSELFGASWIDQPIEFRYDGGAPAAGTARMIGPAGAEVPFQWVTSCSDKTAVHGCIAVRGSLPANTTNAWTLQTGAPSATPANPVVQTQAGNNLQVSNGLTGFRLVTQAGNPTPYNLAPIQGIMLQNGTWTGAGSSPNFIYTEAGGGFAGAVGGALTTPAYTTTAYNVTVTDPGPLKFVVKATYTFNRPRYSYGSTLINQAGQGHYTIIFTMYAGSKSILIDEDSDMQFSYYLPLYAQLMPDTARYRGHDALDANGLSDPVCGYEGNLSVSSATNASPIVITAPGDSLSNGQVVSIAGVQGNTAANGQFYVKVTGYSSGQFALYQDVNLTQPVQGNGVYSGGGIAKPAYRGAAGLYPAPDGYLDLTYSANRPAAYICSAASYRKTMVNYPSADHAAGWYSVLYNSTAGPSAPAVGVYEGRFSQQITSAYGPSTPGVYTSNKHWISNTTDGGLQVDNLLRSPSAQTTTLVHRNWAIWVSTQADLLTPSLHQPIADEQNSLTGINLSRLYTYQLVYPDPPGGWQWQYLSAANANRLISWVQNGTQVCGSVNCYYNLLYSSESSQWGRAILNMWQANSSAAVQTALNLAVQVAQNLTHVLAAGDNRFDGNFGYYQLGLQTSPATAVLNAVIMNPNTTPAQKTTAKACLALFGSLFWDDDWWPIDNNSGDSVGLANQIEQYLQYRAQSAAAAGVSQPYLSTMIPTALQYPLDDFSSYFSSTGAAAGSTHYQSAFFEPMILNYLNFSQDGEISMTDPKWSAYANWELSIQTPPEPRFGNIRKGYSNGDGNTEADVRTGMLATALEGANLPLAQNLMWAWQQSNSATTLTEDQQFVTTVVAIDPTINPVQPALGSLNIPGYHTAERHNFATPYETALWFINGGFYSQGGHRHFDDGQISIYANSAPLAIDWNANLYSPETPGRFMHDSVVLDSELSHAWSADGPSLADVSTLLGNPTNTEFTTFQNSTSSTATFTELDGTVWMRTARTMAFDQKYPSIYVYDSFSGPSAGAGKTITWNMMATGAVSTPSGAVTPPARFSAGCQSIAGQLPSSGSLYSLSSGLQQFNFTGVTWPKHATGGIDWDLFVAPTSSSAQFTLGNWGHGCQSSRESSEFQTANGAAFSEIQDILRVHDTGPFTTLILPYRKTEVPARTVTQAACGIQIALASETTCINNSLATFTNGSTSIATVYDSSTQSAFGLTLSGGPQEVVVQTGQIAWTISGVESGTRTLTLPGNWAPNINLTQASPGVYTYSYTGGLQAAPVTITFIP